MKVTLVVHARMPLIIHKFANIFYKNSKLIG
nr:MAG TPA: hypothetical protein [Caudoviricetes sp.]